MINECAMNELIDISHFVYLFLLLLMAYQRSQPQAIINASTPLIFPTHYLNNTSKATQRMSHWTTPPETAFVFPMSPASVYGTK
jgi:hypothetical protein